MSRPGAEPLTEAVHSARQSGKPVKLSSYQGLFGKPVVLYFYPADGTPGCTKQAQALKESFAEFKKVPGASHLFLVQCIMHS